MNSGTKPPTRPCRRSLRLPAYDYSQAGAYFVTICCQAKKSFFGEIISGEMIFDHVGKILPPIWEQLSIRFPGAELDVYVVMPNHLHGIIMLGQVDHPRASGILTGSPEAIPQEGKPDGDAMNGAPTLGDIIRTFKAVTTRLVRKVRPDFAWQRNYYEHIIRHDTSLDRIREYIANNPLRWELDRENPRSSGTDDFDRWLATFRNTPPARKM